MGRKAIGWLLAAAVVVAVSGDVARAGDPPPKPIVRAADFEKRVSAAIAKGVAWLRTARPKDEWFNRGEITVWGGASPAQVYHTLRTCGVAADDQVATAVFDAMKRHYAARRKGPKDKDGELLETIDYGMMCMALAAHGRPLAASDLFGERTYRLDDDDSAWMRDIVKYLEDTQDARGQWTHFDHAVSARIAGPDHISTQYALLGLKAASRCGIRAKPATWMKSLQHYLDAQETAPDGGKAAAGRGWRSRKTDGMADPWGTAGGVSALMICRSELFGDPKVNVALDARAQRAVRDALAWIATRFVLYAEATASKPTPADLGATRLTFDILYALERAGDLAQVQRMGEHDWYGVTAEWLTASQCRSGAWLEQDFAGNTTDVVDRISSTCFALLTLQRGTLPVVTRAFDDTDVNFAVVPALSDGDFDDFIDLVLSRWRRTTDAAVKDRFFAKTTAVGPRIVAPLVRRLSSAKPEERASAFALLKRATGLDNGFDPAAADDARASGVAAWTSWLAANEPSLRFDAATGRIVAGK